MGEATAAVSSTSWRWPLDRLRPPAETIVSKPMGLISSVKSNRLVLSKSIIATRPVLKGDLVKMTCGSYNI